MRKKADIEKKKIMEQFTRLKNKKGNSMNRSGFQKLASDLGVAVEVGFFLIDQLSELIYSLGSKP